MCCRQRNELRPISTTGEWKPACTPVWTPRNMTTAAACAAPNRCGCIRCSRAWPTASATNGCRAITSRSTSPPPTAAGRWPPSTTALRRHFARHQRQTATSSPETTTHLSCIGAAPVASYFLPGIFFRAGIFSRGHLFAGGFSRAAFRGRLFAGGFSTNGAAHTSPGHRPGFGHHTKISPEGAIHRTVAVGLERPFRASMIFVMGDPGRCPGLVWGRAFGPQDVPARRIHSRPSCF